MATAKKTIKIEQIASPLRCHHDQRETLVGLGLNKIGRVKDLPDTPSTHGMIRKIRHLVRVVENAK
jgi:large subunit ribosomal protein L30